MGSGPGCQHTLQAALDAAHDGDTIKVSAGTFAGGVTITKSVSVVGAGAGATKIKGGAPVVTVGEEGDATPPVVKLASVKVTGGRVGEGVFAAAGGGINVPVGGADFNSPGATLTIKDAVISGNRAAPTETLLPESPEQEEDWPHCPVGFCAFAGGFGAGIQNLGNLTLIRTRVSDNVAGGPVASDAAGAGIWSSVGTVTIEDSALVRNRSVVGDPNGRFAEGGAMLVENGSGPVVIRDTLIGDNRAELSSQDS